MNSIKAANKISNLTLRKWLTNPTIYILFLMILAAICRPLIEIAITLFKNNLKLSPFIFPFLMVSSYFRLTITFGVILLFCDAPFKNQEQLYVISRVSKTTWVCGQILYIIKGAIIYYGSIFLFSFIIILPFADFHTDWSVGISLLKSMPFTVMFNFNAMIIDFYTPIWATVHTLLLHMLMGIFLALVMFCFNTITAKFVGITVTVVLTLAILMIPMFESWFLWIIPINLTSLAILDPFGIIDGSPKLWYAYVFFIAMNLLLAFLAIRVTKNNLLGGAV